MKNLLNKNFESEFDTPVRVKIKKKDVSLEDTKPDYQKKQKENKKKFNSKF